MKALERDKKYKWYKEQYATILAERGALLMPQPLNQISRKKTLMTDI